MPWFRFIGENGARCRLRFRNAEVQLVFANLQGREPDPAGLGCWAWVAQKPDGAQIILVRRGNMMALSGALSKFGFEVAAGTPAEKIMRAAEKCGHAEELPMDERWRPELIRARGRGAP